MSLNATVQYMAITVTNPALADDILYFLLSNETNTYSARQLAGFFNVSEPDIQDQIREINDLKARWIYEIQYIGTSEKHYIIGNCKPQIKEYLKKGGFTKMRSNSFSFLLNPSFKKHTTLYNQHVYLFWVIAAVVLLAFVYIFTNVL